MSALPTPDLCSLICKNQSTLSFPSPLQALALWECILSWLVGLERVENKVYKENAVSRNQGWAADIGKTISDFDPIFPRIPFRNKSPRQNSGWILGQMRTSQSTFYHTSLCTSYTSLCDHCYGIKSYNKIRSSGVFCLGILQPISSPLEMNFVSIGKSGRWDASLFLVFIVGMTGLKSNRVNETKAATQCWDPVPGLG